MKKISLKELIREEYRKVIKENALLTEMDFATQKSFDAYNKAHKLRPSTKVTIAGKPTTAGQAAGKSAPTNAPIKGADMFKQDTPTKSSGALTSKQLRNKYTDADWDAAKKNAKYGGTNWDTSEIDKIDTSSWNIEDGVTYDQSDEIQSILNKAIGNDNGFAQVNDEGAVEYMVGNGSDGDPEYTLYMGPDDNGKGWTVSMGANGDDPSELDGKYWKTFRNPKDGIKYMATIAKKHKKDLELDNA